MTTTAKSPIAAPKSYQRAALEASLEGKPADDPARALVASSGVQQTLAAFETADAAAMAAQGRYRRWMRRGLRATTLGVLIGAMLLLPIDAWIEGVPRYVIGALQALAVFTTFAAVVAVARWRPLDTWMASRAKAERLRGAVFEQIVDAQVGGEPGTVAKAKLDVFMRAYIEDQIGFFEARTRQHRRLASDLSPVRLVGYSIICIGAITSVVVVLSKFGIAIAPVTDWLERWIGLTNSNRWQLALTTAASGLMSYATQRTLLDEDARKAALYDATAKKLRRLIDREHAATAAAAAKGDDTAVKAFFAKARTILELEHAVWSFVHDVGDGEEGDRAVDARAR